MNSSVTLINPNPIVYERRKSSRLENEVILDEDVREDIDSGEIFEYLKDIKDPEHPYSLEQLNVVREEQIDVDDPGSFVK